MRSLFALAFALAACGDDDGDDTAPPAASCLSPADLRAPTDANRTCIRKVFSTEPARAAAVLGQLDWVQWKDTTRQLEALPVEDRWWYLVALEPGATSRVALSALQIARRTTDPVFAADIDLATIDIAMRARDESTANTAIENMLVNDDKLGAQKRQLLDLVAKRNEQPRIDRICRKQNEAAIAWRCLELAPALRESRAAVAQLPVLSYRDVDKLAPLREKLVGLRCVSESARGIRSLFDRVDSRDHSTPEEVAIYSRLALDAPDKANACFLEEAARGCLALIRNNEPCPVLDSLARYVAVLSERDRMAAFQAVFEGKNREYDALFNDGREGAGANLFHLHVLLGEMLVANDLFPEPTQAFQTPYFHVIRAWRFWADVNNPSVFFIDMLTPKLRETFCAEPCAQVCRFTYHGTPSCSSGCPTVREKLSCR